MTIKQTLAAINALPNVHAIWNSEYKEFMVRYKNMPEMDYFTEWKDDALGTAKRMSESEF